MPEEPQQFPFDDEVLDEDKRLVRAWAAINVRDKDGQIVPVEKIAETLPIIQKRFGGIPISDEHYDRIIGKGYRWQIAQHPVYKTKGLQMDYEVFHDLPYDDQVWDEIKTGKRKGLSYSGVQRDPKDAEYVMAGGLPTQVLGDLDSYGFASCFSPRNPAAVNTHVNYVAKSDSANSLNAAEVLKAETFMKAGANNPWAICTATVGRENKAKFERCVMHLKERLGIEKSDNGVPVKENDADTGVPVIEFETEEEVKKAEGRAGLVRRQVDVTVDGKTFKRWAWVKPESGEPVGQKNPVTGELAQVPSTKQEKFEEEYLKEHAREAAPFPEGEKTHSFREKYAAALQQGRTKSQAFMDAFTAPEKPEMGMQKFQSKLTSLDEKTRSKVVSAFDSLSPEKKAWFLSLPLTSMILTAQLVGSTASALSSMGKSDNLLKATAVAEYGGREMEAPKEVKKADEPAPAEADPLALLKEISSKLSELLSKVGGAPAAPVEASATMKAEMSGPGAKLDLPQMGKVTIPKHATEDNLATENMPFEQEPDKVSFLAKAVAAELSKNPAFVMKSTTPRPEVPQTQVSTEPKKDEMPEALRVARFGSERPMEIFTRDQDEREAQLVKRLEEIRAKGYA